ncbi:MAG: hypothetical protein RLZ55_1518 [Actinomycetota bacterium]
MNTTDVDRSARWMQLRDELDAAYLRGEDEAWIAGLRAGWAAGSDGSDPEPPDSIRAAGLWWLGYEHGSTRIRRLLAVSSRHKADRGRALAEHGVSLADWKRQAPGQDDCGCDDDRCIGHHHGQDEECRCVTVLLGRTSGERGA